MDPVTIAGAALKGAQTAWDAGSILWRFIQSTKIVDQSVKNLASEANSLGNACEAVNKQLKVLPTFHKDAGDLALFSSIQIQLSECDRCMSRLSLAISSVRGDSPSSIKQAVCFSICSSPVRVNSFDR